MMLETMKRSAFLALAALAACGPAEPPRPPPLTADPPIGASSADDGAAATELQRGIAYIKNDKYPEAKQHLEQSVQLKKSSEGEYYLGVVREKLGDKAGAEEAYKAALELDPAFAEAVANLSALYLDDPARPDLAIKILKAAIEKIQGDNRLVQNLAYAYGLKGDVDASSKLYEQLLRKGDNLPLRFAYASMLFDNKQAEKAAVELKKCLAATADDAPMLVTLGRMLGGVKAYGDCVAAIDRALKLKSDDPEWYVRRGICKYEIDDEIGASADFQASIKVDPKFATGHYYLGRSLLREKKRLQAITEFEKAVALGGDSEIGRAAKVKLDEVKSATFKKK